MEKEYTFLFPGTRSDLQTLLDRYPNNDHRFWTFDNYTVETMNDGWRFGVARCGHAGGHYFIPSVTEHEGKLLLSGALTRVGSPSSVTHDRRTHSRIGTICVFVLLSPFIFLILLAVKVWLLLRALVGKIVKRPPQREPTPEERLTDLMVGHLHCSRL